MKVAEQSPRIEKDGSIRWYYGDTFVITLIFRFVDEEGHEIEPKENDTLEVIIKDYKNDIVASFTSIGKSTVDINMTKEITKELIEGVYAMDVKYNGTFVTTLLKNNKVVVE